jgi:hypothetical protein
LYLFTIRSRVNPKSKATKASKSIGGAYVNCYISFPDSSPAEELARLLIKQQRWIPLKTTDAWKRPRAKLKSKEDRQYYSEALKYGYCLIFHTWPKR